LLVGITQQRIIFIKMPLPKTCCGLPSPPNFYITEYQNHSNFNPNLLSIFSINIAMGHVYKVLGRCNKISPEILNLCFKTDLQAKTSF